jgi:hypothetical protein
MRNFSGDYTAATPMGVVRVDTAESSFNRSRLAEQGVCLILGKKEEQTTPSETGL